MLHCSSLLCQLKPQTCKQISYKTIFWFSHWAADIFLADLLSFLFTIAKVVLSIRSNKNGTTICYADGTCHLQRFRITARWKPYSTTSLASKEGVAPWEQTTALSVSGSKPTALSVHGIGERQQPVVLSESSRFHSLALGLPCRGAYLLPRFGCAACNTLCLPSLFLYFHITKGYVCYCK